MIHWLFYVLSFVNPHPRALRRTRMLPLLVFSLAPTLLPPSRRFPRLDFLRIFPSLGLVRRFLLAGSRKPLPPVVECRIRHDL
jgi:hypothetical protein